MKVLQYITIFALSVFFPTSGFSQGDLDIGLTSGLGRIFSTTNSFSSDLPGKDYGANFNSSRFSAGISLNYKISGKWEVASGLLYGVSRYQFGFEFVNSSNAINYTSKARHTRKFWALPFRLYREILTFDEKNSSGLRGIIGAQYNFGGKSKISKLIGDKINFFNANTSFKPFYAQWGIKSLDYNPLFIQLGTGVTKSFENGDRFALDLVFSLGLKKLLKGKQYGFYDVEKVDYAYNQENHEFESFSQEPGQQFKFFSRGTSLTLNLSYYFSL